METTTNENTGKGVVIVQRHCESCGHASMSECIMKRCTCRACMCHQIYQGEQPT